MILLAFIALCLCPFLLSNSMPIRFLLSGVFMLAGWPRIFTYLGRPARWFMAWLAWAVLGCFLCDHPLLAINGWHLRCEGAITYVLLTYFAWIYWSRFYDLKPITFVLIGLCLVYPIAGALMPEDFFMRMCLPNVALGSLAALSVILAFNLRWELPILCLPALVQSGSRSALAAVLGGVAIASTGWFISQFKGRLTLIRGLLVVLAMAVASMCYAPLRHKVLSTHFDFSGSRSQWIRQVNVLAYTMPLTGYGLDTGSEYLKPATGPTVDQGKTPDRAHFLPADILLWTGWVGLILVFGVLVEAFVVTVSDPSAINIGCFSSLMGFVIFSCLNPAGVPSLALAILAIFGIKDRKI